MATSLSKLVDNLSDNIHNDKCIKCKSNLCFRRAMNEKFCDINTINFVIMV